MATHRKIAVGWLNRGLVDGMNRCLKIRSISSLGALSLATSIYPKEHNSRNLKLTIDSYLYRILTKDFFMTILFL